MNRKIPRAGCMGMVVAMALGSPALLLAEEARSSMQLTVQVVDSTAGSSPSALWTQVPVALGVMGLALMLLSCALRPFVSWRIESYRFWLLACHRLIHEVAPRLVSAGVLDYRSMVGLPRRGLEASAVACLKVLSRPGTLVSG